MLCWRPGAELDAAVDALIAQPLHIAVRVDGGSASVVWEFGGRGPGPTPLSTCTFADAPSRLGVVLLGDDATVEAARELLPPTSLCQALSRHLPHPQLEL